MQKTILFLLFISCGFYSFSQTKPDYNFYEYTNLEAGYNYNFSKPNSRNFHLISVGVNKTIFGGRHAGVGYAYGAGSDIGLNTYEFIMAPKINGFLYYQFFVIGSALTYYTNFTEGTLRYIPMFGIGGPKAKLTFNPHVILTNKDFQPINKITVQVTVNFTLNKKRKNYERLKNKM